MTRLIPNTISAEDSETPQPARSTASSNTPKSTLDKHRSIVYAKAQDVTQVAGLRNDAAHGEHDLLSRERAGLMEQQVNLFLTRLEQAVQQST